ncbi:methyl-viologen-reducing hydrogenase subunit delta [Simplicispira suum]|uniref:Methyl-viologen-reducing hydrogenase subunit delta n=1 Tax=Simplicispira suum TaxID=2109915 RepID=A0A2S0MYI7_9BURK|nr:methyl-viologen-reducing hydrogenase subunit delta [Simplicispira suum]
MSVAVLTRRAPAPAPPRIATRWWRALEHGFDALVGAGGNPLKQLGALAFLLLWLLVVSGAVLYAVLDTSASGAYQSIEMLSREPRRWGSLLRGLHRYAADAMVLVVLAHVVREWMLGRFRSFRAASWLTGVPLLLLLFVSAIGGFWLNWDRLGQFSATATAEWLDALPGLASPLARNFLGGTQLNDRLFSLFVFVHVGVPLMLVFGLWFHVQRLSRAQVFPARALAIGTGVTLLMLAALLPVRSQGPADLATVPAVLNYDWLLLFIHPLTAATSAAIVWGLLGLSVALLLALPWLGVRRVRAQPVAPGAATANPAEVGAAPPATSHTHWRPTALTQFVAEVDPDHCSGCRRCVEDCPYAAITMVPHPSGRVGMELAQVRSDLCASCGICVGSCPSSTPFRSAEVLHTGIDMPQWPIDDLRRQMLSGLAALPGPRRYVVFGCAEGADLGALSGSDVLTLPLVCTGLLPPSFIEYALRAGADGVLVASCREGGCAFRLGERWTRERLQGVREPRLRASVPAERWSLVAVDPGDEAVLTTSFQALRSRTAKSFEHPESTA